MKGAGKHIARVGGANVDYAHRGPSSTLHGHLGAATEIMRALFTGAPPNSAALATHAACVCVLSLSCHPPSCTGKGVKYETLNPLGGKKPPTWAASRNLGNPPHYDHKDAHRGYAQWYVERGELHDKITSWWFLLPEHGIAIELCDGAAISWDGRAVIHCSSVPNSPTALYSLWCSVPATAVARHEGDVECKVQLKASAGQKQQLHKGDKCHLLWTGPNDTGKRAHDAIVDAVFDDGRVRVVEKKGKGSEKTTLSAVEVDRYLAPR
jgi:hypothetical protein